MDVAKTISAVAASVAALGGSYTLADKFGWLDKPILNWSPEHFEISDGSAGGEFKVVVARQKLRDDCEVTNFKIEIKDSDFVVHPAIPSIATFSGPATPTVDKFGYKFTLSPEVQKKIAAGEATLMAHIKYKCPEREVVVNYPNHKNLKFNITRGKA
jgi:hypothetical protein